MSEGAGLVEAVAAVAGGSGVTERVLAAAKTLVTALGCSNSLQTPQVVTSEQETMEWMTENGTGDISVVVCRARARSSWGQGGKSCAGGMQGGQRTSRQERRRIRLDKKAKKIKGNPQARDYKCSLVHMPAM